MQCRVVSLLLVSISVVVMTRSVSAVTINVPADVPTIQGAIQLAVPGDEVVVAPGIYNESIDFLGKAITVRSLTGAQGTLIDATGFGTVVSFTSGEELDSVLEGFTLQNGHAPGTQLDDGGGGIFCESSSPTIRDNVIRDNTAHWNGAGIFLVDSEALVEGNRLETNSFLPLVADAPFGRGAGINVTDGAPTIRGNWFIGNVGTDEGGGVFCSGAQTLILENNIIRNNASGYGGGIAIDGNSLVLARNNLVLDNLAFGLPSFAGPTEGFGGGIYIVNASSALFENLTLVGNTAQAGFNGPGTGGGIYALTIVALVPFLENAIVRGNTAGIDSQLSGNLSVNYSNVEGGALGLSNFDADPLFVSGPEGNFYLSQVAAGQAQDSPCLDAGNPNSPLLPGTTTRTDEVEDSGLVDVGFHHRISLGVPFRRGDCNSDGATNIADAVFALLVLFPPPGGPGMQPSCADACDGNDDGQLNIADAVRILNALFGSPTLPLPAPAGMCGVDGTGDSLGCALDPNC